MEESCEHPSSFIFDWINLILASNKDMHESLNEFKFRPDNSRVMCPCTSKNCCEHSSAYIFDWIFFIFSGNEDTQQVWTEFEFWPDGTKGCRVIALDRCQKLVFSSPEPKAHRWAYRILMVRRPSVVVRCCRPSLTISNIFSSATAWPIKAKFYLEPPWVGGTKVCSRHLGHMTKMAATPIYGKNPSKIFFSRTGRPIFTKLGM